MLYVFYKKQDSINKKEKKKDVAKNESDLNSIYKLAVIPL